MKTKALLVIVPEKFNPKNIWNEGNRFIIFEAIGKAKEAKEFNVPILNATYEGKPVKLWATTD